jgi:hypothetical protein
MRATALLGEGKSVGIVGGAKKAAGWAFKGGGLGSASVARASAESIVKRGGDLFRRKPGFLRGAEDLLAERSKFKIQNVPGDMFRGLRGIGRSLSGQVRTVGPQLFRSIAIGIRGVPSLFLRSFRALPGLLMRGGGGIFTGLISGFLRLRPILMGLARLSLVGAGILLIIKGFQGLMQNIGGVRDYIVNLWDRIVVQFESIADVFKPVTSLFSEGSALNYFFKMLLPTVISSVLEMVERIMYYVKVIGGFLGAAISDIGRLISEGPTKIWQEVAAETERDIARAVKQRQMDREAKKAKDAASVKTPSDRENRNFIFPNARFDITQKFAEGFDPDRIAVAFAKDISTMGERRLGSALTPFHSS